MPEGSLAWSLKSLVVDGAAKRERTMSREPVRMPTVSGWPLRLAWKARRLALSTSGLAICRSSLLLRSWLHELTRVALSRAARTTGELATDGPAIHCPCEPSVSMASTHVDESGIHAAGASPSLIAWATSAALWGETLNLAHSSPSATRVRALSTASAISGETETLSVPAGQADTDCSSSRSSAQAAAPRPSTRASPPATTRAHGGRRFSSRRRARLRSDLAGNSSPAELSPGIAESLQASSPQASSGREGELDRSSRDIGSPSIRARTGSGTPGPGCHKRAVHPRRPASVGRVCASSRSCNTARMVNLAVKIAVNAVALWVAAFLVGGIKLAEDGSTFASRFTTVLLVAVLFGLINAVVKPIAKLLSFPAIVLTLGLFTFIVNAFMLQLTEWISEPLGLSFSIDQFFWDAVIGALIVTVVSMVLNFVIPDGDDA